MTINKLIIALLSVISILLLSITFFLEPESELYLLLNYYDYALCAFFLYDFFSELKQSKNRWKFFYTYGWLDLLSSIPVIHELRFARGFRIFRILRIFKSYKILISFLKSNKKDSFYALRWCLSLLIVIISSFLTLYFEQNFGNIYHSWRNALVEFSHHHNSRLRRFLSGHQHGTGFCINTHHYRNFWFWNGDLLFKWPGE